jgi:hypothetical protein
MTSSQMMRSRSSAGAGRVMAPSSNAASDASDWFAGLVDDAALADDAAGADDAEAADGAAGADDAMLTSMGRAGRGGAAGADDAMLASMGRAGRRAAAAAREVSGVCGPGSGDVVNGRTGASLATNGRGR